MTSPNTPRAAQHAGTIELGQARTPALLIDGKACAAMLGISHRTLLRLVERGDAPVPVKLGRLTRWRAADVLAYVNALGRRQARSEEPPQTALASDA